MHALRGTLVLLLLITILTASANAQALPLDSIKSQQELDKAVALLDAALFDAYNRCDLEKFSSFFVDDVEFYHDQGGVTLGRQNLTDSVKKNICGKVTRELVPGTLQVYYMKGYGAVEMGVHRFHHPGHEDTEGVGEGKFIHLWQYKDVPRHAGGPATLLRRKHSATMAATSPAFFASRRVALFPLTPSLAPSFPLSVQVRSQPGDGCAARHQSRA